MFEFLGANSKWQVQSLGDFLEIRGDSWINIDDDIDYRILGVTSKGAGLVIKRKVSGAELKMRQYQVARLNQLMWCKVDTTNGAFGITKPNHVEALSSPNMCLADINTEICLPDFLQLFFRMPVVYKGITSASLGTTNRQYLKPQELLKKIRLHLPPLNEQRRILARVETLATSIAKAQHLRKEADREAELLFQSQVNKLLEEEEGLWKMGTLPEFVSSNRHSVKRGPFGSHLRKEFFVESGYKIYEQRHAIYGDFNAGRYFIDEEKFQQLKSFEVKPGDIIISCSGTIGKVAVVPETAMPGIINQALLKLTLDTNKIDRRFFKIVFESDFIKQEVAAMSLGSAMKNIGSVKILKKIKFPLPPLDEQRRIVAYLDSVQARLASLRELQSATGEELSALLPSVLDRAFKGEL